MGFALFLFASLVVRFLAKTVQVRPHSLSHEFAGLVESCSTRKSAKALGSHLQRLTAPAEGTQLGDLRGPA